MLKCRACLWRCLRALSHDLPLESIKSSFQSTTRSYSTGALRTRSNHAHSLQREQAQAVSGSNSIIKAAKAATVGQRGKDESITSSQLRRLKLEVPWLGEDRVKVLRRTKELLRNGRQPEALELVRLASKDVPCTIAWNAVLEDLMVRHKVNEAFKVYNDMKKRAQIPDSYTYSTLFNGLIANRGTPSAATRAVQLWQSLNSPTSKVKPSILLTNAALKACASAGDMDALWAIAGAIPESGAEAANGITYTTILNAMRLTTAIELPRRPDEAQSAALATAVAQGRQIWVDVISRWTKAKLTLDEDLVGAMGRLLLASEQARDWDDIFQLCLQTMNIPRASPPLAIRDRTHNPHNIHQLPAPFLQSDRTVDMDAADVTPDTGKEYGAVKLHSKGVWVKPSNQILTLLMETCQKMFLAKTAAQYWEILTERYAVAPDSASYHAYLRMLRQSKSSSEVLRVVRDEMKNEPGAAKTFRISISACVRNQFSPSAMREATELMDLMLMRLKRVDLKAGSMFMKLALSSPHTQDTLVALNYMTPSNITLWETIKSGSQQQQHDLAELGRQVISGFDRVIAARMYSKEAGGFDDFSKRKAAWTYAVQRLMNGGKRVEPTRSEEETVLLEKKRALLRFERKKQRDNLRMKKSRSQVTDSIAPKEGKLPKLEVKA